MAKRKSKKRHISRPKKAYRPQHYHRYVRKKRSLVTNSYAMMKEADGKKPFFLDKGRKNATFYKKIGRGIVALRKRPRSPIRGLIQDSFPVIRRIKVCLNRFKRRQILFSTGKAGSGRKIKTPKKYTQNSKVRC